MRFAGVEKLFSEVSDEDVDRDEGDLDSLYFGGVVLNWRGA